MAAKVYFIAYRWRVRGTINWFEDNEIVDNHPIDWLERRLLDHDNYEHVLTFYADITENRPEIVHAWKEALK